MTWEHDQLWCECDGATTETSIGSEVFKCLQCGKTWRWSEVLERWEEVC